MARLRHGPVKKFLDETFLTWINFSNVLPDGETFSVPASSARAFVKVGGADATATILGTPSIVFVGAVMYVRLRANTAGDEGRYVVELVAVSDAGTTFEAEIEIAVGEREPVRYITKFSQEVFNVGIDFEPELVNLAVPGEQVTGAAVESKEKYSGADTTATLINGAALIQGSAVAANLRADPGGQVGRHVVKLRASTDGVDVPDSLPNVYEETIEIDVVAS